jgi:hypothetical protein
MSQYVTKLRQRDGINWPTPPGTWQQNEEINRLEMFANNLDVSQSPGDTDLLNSVPTPWARLLLFESALYRPSHPSHADVEDQWRGLLGVLALAAPLRLKVQNTGFRLSQYPDSRIGRTFAALRPAYMTGGQDQEAGKWDDFQIITVDGTIVGATSPRTLVFTGIAHRCPPSVPFRTSTGRLTDPATYYRRFNDRYFLGLLAYWIQSLIGAIETDNTDNIADLMGTVPAARGADIVLRSAQLLDRLRAWRSSPELQGVAQVQAQGASIQHFTLQGYRKITGLPPVTLKGESDLLLMGSRDVLVCYSDPTGAEPSARLITATGQEVVNEPIRVYDGRWVYSTQPLPLPFSDFLPPHVKVITDPMSLFEDALIKVNLPPQSDSVYALRIGNEQSAHTYLYPFKSDILNYLTPKQIAENTRVSINQATNRPRVELEIPLENNRKIRAAREYDPDTGAVITNLLTANLAAWPDFVSPAWRHYFYLKRSVASGNETDFAPTGGIPFIERFKDGQTWYSSARPFNAFVGTAAGKSGLLLPRHAGADPPDKFWKVAVDFGSTHTRAFSLEVEKRGKGYATAANAEINPIAFATRARPLTLISKFFIRDLFFALAGEIEPEEREELKTLMMMPETSPGQLNDWLPREGYIYTHWIYGGGYNATNLRSDLKWNPSREDPDLRAFLRCLLLTIKAEAFKQRARVVSIVHTYPSVLTPNLVAKHASEWRGLRQYINNGAAADEVVDIPDAGDFYETIAVMRHLEWEQEGRSVINTISLDVGGSTTDIAVWAKKKLRVQESLKMAAGIVGRYLQTGDARDFLTWLEGTLNGEPFKLNDFKLSNLAGKTSTHGLVFNNALSAVEWQGHLDVLIKEINGAKESYGLRAHIAYLYGSLIYYAGLLARKEKLPEEQNSYQLYFCGKGGTLISWFDGYARMAQEMFEAGLFGPAGRGQNPRPRVIVKMSAMPKQEVGRGLLAESYLEGNRGEEVELIDLSGPSVTVGDTGYGNLTWDGELKREGLLDLTEDDVPQMADLQELNNFRTAFSTATSTKSAAVLLGLNDSHVDADFPGQLMDRLFGSKKGSVISDIQRNDDDALLEPLFITEVKVLLETATRNSKLFA